MILGHSTENTSYFLVNIQAIFRKFPSCTLRTLHYVFWVKQKVWDFLQMIQEMWIKLLADGSHIILKYLIVTNSKVYIFSFLQMACQVLIFMSTCFHKDNILRVKIQWQPIVSQGTEQNVSDKVHAYHLSLLLININILDPCCT